MKYKILLPCLMVLGLAIGIGMQYGSPRDNIPQGVTLDGNQCVYITRADGSKEDLGCRHNVLTNVGKNAIRDFIGVGGFTADYNYIGIGNDTGVPAAGDTALEKEWDACGMTRATATYAALATGNWSMVKTFTSTCDGVVVNASGMFNDTSPGVMLCAANFTQGTLQTSDEITVTWNFSTS